MDDACPNAPQHPSTALRISTAEDDLRWAARDFGGTVSHRPRAVLRPRNVEEIAAALQLGHVLVPRAQGHSTAGQAQALDGCVLDMNAFTTIHSVEDDRVVVDAGARWDEVLDATLPCGLTPPVLTDYLGLSVGGTLSVGGFGGASHRHGAQTDTTLELDVLTPSGGRTTCSATRNKDLFDAVRAGRGRNGIILRATVKLVPAPRFTRTYKLVYHRLSTFLNDQRRLAQEGRFDHLEGQPKPTPDGWSYRIEATAYLDHHAQQKEELLTGLEFDECERSAALPYRDFAHRMAPEVALLTELGPWRQPHPWCNLLLPDTEAEQLVAAALDGMTQADLGQAGLMLLYPLRRDLVTTPLLRMPTSRVVFLHALLRTATETTAPTMVDHNTRLQATVEAHGGFAYLDEL